MKRTVLALILILLASPACAATFNFSAGWNDDSPSNVKSEFVTDLNGNGVIDSGEVKCSVDQGQPSVCTGSVPDTFAGKTYWVRTYNSVGQWIDTEHFLFSVTPPIPATGVFFNAIWINP